MSKPDKERIQATISGRSLWAFRRIQAAEGKDDSATLELIMILLMERDEELVERYGFSLEDYRNARASGIDPSAPLPFERPKSRGSASESISEPKVAKAPARTEQPSEEGNGTEDR